MRCWRLPGSTADCHYGPRKPTRALLSPWKSVGFFPQLRGGCWILWRRQEGRSQLVPSADDSHTATLWCGPSERPSSPWQPPSIIQNAHWYLQPRPGGRDLPQREAKPPWTRKIGAMLRSAEARKAGAEMRCSRGPSAAAQGTPGTLGVPTHGTHTHTWVHTTPLPALAVLVARARGGSDT